MTFTPARLAALVGAPLLASLAACVVAPPPPPPAHHPAWLRALTDLRDARWSIEHRPGDADVGTQEGIALSEIDAAMADARRAAAEDGRNLGEHPRQDVAVDYRARLHAADALLRKARSDVAQAEDNPATRELRNHAVGHIDAAIGATDRAIHDAERGL